MELLDPVIYYTHEASNADHTTIDQAALVTRVVDNNTLDVVIFPPNGPVTFARVSTFDPKAPVYQVGGAYWREADSDAPDFTDHFKYMNDPEWSELRGRQQQELLSVSNPKALDALRAKHLDEQAKLNQRLEAKHA